ncbi:hypothetical protein CMK11_01295 [Candidatus Poribacteria bacterium]|nr:hypothetical protein [Candidatus Poribacteria bacterium]
MFQFYVRRRATAIAAGLLATAMLLGCGKKEDTPARPPASGTPPPAMTPAAPPAAPAAATEGTASIAGKVTFTGAAPVVATMDMNADPVCAGMHTGPVGGGDAIVAADGGLKNVIVYVQSGASSNFSAPEAAVVLDQKGCVFEPHVVALQVGQTLKFVNSDTTTHNVHTLSDLNRAFNTSMPIPNMEIEKTFDDVEIFKIKCDVHPWMSSWVGVFDNPFFAVTDADGSFELAGLPAGTYTVVAVHEKYGEKPTEVTVGDGEAGTADFAYGG